jgi:hypothetical protein
MWNALDITRVAEEPTLPLCAWRWLELASKLGRSLYQRLIKTGKIEFP